MRTAMHPANHPLAVEKRRAGQLRSVFQAARAQVHVKTRRARLFMALPQRAIERQPPEIVLFQPHRPVRTLVRIGKAARRIAEAFAESCGDFRRSHDDKAHGDAGSLEFRIEFAQLRERFTEERSTDVAQPHDQRGQRNT